MAFGDILQTDSAAIPNTDTVSTVSVTLGEAITEGSLLLTFHFTGDANSIGPGTFSEAFALTNATETDEGALYYKIAGSSESTTITCTSDSDDEQYLLVLEVEGAWNAAPFDKTAETGRTTATESISTNTTAETSQADELAAAMVIQRTKDLTNSWTNSFVNRGDITNAGEVGWYKTMGCATKLLSSAAAIESTASWSGATTALAGVGTFMAAAGGDPAVSESDDLTIGESIGADLTIGVGIKMDGAGYQGTGVKVL